MRSPAVGAFAPSTWSTTSIARRSTSKSTHRSLHNDWCASSSSCSAITGCHRCCAPTTGPEFLGEVFVQWAKANGMAIQYIQPGKPNQNAYIERFNRTFREELLDQHLFLRLEDVREAVLVDDRIQRTASP